MQSSDARLRSVYFAPNALLRYEFRQEVSGHVHAFPEGIALLKHMTVRQQIEQIADRLPVPVYLVAKDGRILYANERLQRLFGMSGGDLVNRNIVEFYADPVHRATLLDEIGNRGELVKEIVAFTAGDRVIQTQMSCNSVEDERGDFLGYFGVLQDVTAETQYRGIFDAHLPAGVYRFDENDSLTQANLGFVKVHGYDSVEEVLNRPTSDFFYDPGESIDVKRDVLRSREIHRRKVTLRRKDGQPFSAYLTAVGFFNRQGQYAGQAGVIEDRTLEDQYERLLQDIPVGFYVVESRGEKDVVVDCNEEFARIFDVPLRAEMIGKNIRDFHASPEETARLMQQLTQAATSGGTLLGQQMRIRTARGTLKTIENNARTQIHAGRIVGRTGAIRDITSEMEMRDWINTLTNDIGGVLHTFRHTLTQLKHNISSVTDILVGGVDTSVRPQPPEELEEQVLGPLHELVAAVDRFLGAATDVRHDAPLNKRDAEDLQRLMRVLQDYRRHPQMHWRDLWSRGVVEILAICKRIRPGTIAREVYRPMIHAAEKVGGLTALATLSIAREAIAAVETPVEALYRLVIRGQRTEEPREILPIEACVLEAITHVTDFAEERGVSIQFDYGLRTEVSVRRHEITRAIQNLLHNAIKYSWAQNRKRAAWVDIKVRIASTAAEVVVENWGVPIPEEEIARGLIFHLGFRGRFSSDRGRLGTGVGLADSLRIAHGHGGSLRMESRPASPKGNPNDYDQPFVTRAYLSLPLAGRSIR